MGNLIHITLQNFLNEESKDIFKGIEVLNYFNDIESEHHNEYDDPMKTSYKEQILSNEYILKDISINNLLKDDNDLNDFFKSENNDKDNWDINREVNTYGLIGNSEFANDVLIDGYHRIFQKYINGDETMKIFVPVNSKFE